MKHFLPALLSSAILVMGSVSASDTGPPAKTDAAPAPVAAVPDAGANSSSGGEKNLPPAVINAEAAAPQPQEPNAVQVPETIGVSVLAGVAFLFMFGRRRYA